MTTIAFLGLGNMGGPMAANLVVAGHDVRGFDLVPALQAAAEAKGAKVFEQRHRSGRRCRRGDHLAPQRRHRDGLLRRGALRRRSRARCSSIRRPSPSTTPGRINAQASEQGFAQIDAPVSGGVKGATAGTLAFMVGGDDDAVERARPVLEPMAGKVIHCGGSGNGQSAKLCNNMVLAVQQIAIGEAFVLAEKLGLSAQSLFDVITGATGQLLVRAHQLPCAGTGSDVAGQQRLQAGLRDGSDEQGPRVGDGGGRARRIRPHRSAAMPPRSTPRLRPTMRTRTSAPSSR